MLKTFAGVYVNLFRNIPLILQIVFWYAIFVKFPAPRQTEPFLNAFYFSNRGLQIPTLNVDAGVGVLSILIAIAVFVALLRGMPAALGARILTGIAAVFAFGSALLALVAMMRLLNSISFTPYVIYRVVLGVFLLWIAYT